MIVSNLQNSQRIEGLHPLFKPLFDYVKTHDLLHTDLGRIEIDGENLFINNVNLECVSPDKQVLELHHGYKLLLFLFCSIENNMEKVVSLINEVLPFDIYKVLYLLM